MLIDYTNELDWLFILMMGPDAVEHWLVHYSYCGTLQERTANDLTVLVYYYANISEGKPL